MTFRELLNKYSLSDQLTAIYNLYESEYDLKDFSEDSYKTAILDLKSLEQDPVNKYHLRLYLWETDDEFKPKAVSVDLFETDERGIHYGIGDCWTYILDQDIYIESEVQKLNLSELQIFAYIMWELTFHGYTQMDVSAFFDKLNNEFEECKEYKDLYKDLNLS